MNTIAIVVALMIGIMIGFLFFVFVYGCKSARLEEVKHPIYKDYEDNLYEVLHMDMIEASTLEHYVAYRALYGKRVFWIRKRKDFLNGVIERKGKNIFKFTLLNDK